MCVVCVCSTVAQFCLCVVVKWESKMNQQTPRRLGLSRISPRIKPNPEKKSLSEAANTVENTPKANENIERTTETSEDSFETPPKRRKFSLGRFDFTPKQQPANDLTNENQRKTDDDTKTTDELQKEIQEMKERLEKYEKYSSEKKELEKLIETWKIGGVRALRQLQVEIQPKQEVEQILEHFKLPADIFGDITE